VARIANARDRPAALNPTGEIAVDPEWPISLETDSSTAPSLRYWFVGARWSDVNRQTARRNASTPAPGNPGLR
jgi:hypothetical protein